MASGRDELHVRLHNFGAGLDSPSNVVRSFYERSTTLCQLTGRRLRAALDAERVHFNSFVSRTHIEYEIAKTAFKGSSVELLDANYENWAYDDTERKIVWFDLVREPKNFASTELARFMHEKPLQQSLVMAAYAIDRTRGERVDDEPLGLDYLALFDAVELEDIPREDASWLFS